MQGRNKYNPSLFFCFRSATIWEHGRVCVYYFSIVYGLHDLACV